MNTSLQSPLSTESPSSKPVEGTYVNNQSGIQITFPQGWKGFEIVQGNITFLVLTPQLSFSEMTSEDPPSYIMLQISQADLSISSEIPQNGSTGIPFSFEDIVNPNDSDLSKKLGCIFTTISSENISINETEGKELTYECTFPSTPPTPPVITNGKAFAIEKGENQIIMTYNQLSGQTLKNTCRNLIGRSKV